jgi:hypothetical protein
MGTLRFAHPTMSTDQWVINGYFHNLSGVGAIAGGEARRQGPRQPRTLGGHLAREEHPLGDRLGKGEVGSAAATSKPESACRGGR